MSAHTETQVEPAGEAAIPRQSPGPAPSSDAGPRPGGRAIEGVRVGELSGDRCCVKCQFNLHGQTIIREAQYQLPIVVCPECGTPAPMQEYPVLGRWASRLGFVLAGGWLLALLGGAAFMGLIAALFTLGMTEELAEPWRDFAYRAAEARERSVGPQPQAWTGASRFNAEEWKSMQPAKLFEEAGGWGGAINWRALWFCVGVPVVGVPLGAAWAVALPHARGVRRLLVPLAIVGVAGCIVMVANSFTPTRFGGPWIARELAVVLVAPQLAAVILSIVFASLSVGVCVGRRLARAAIVLFLPPRLRAPLSFIWTADGLRLPRAS